MKNQFQNLLNEYYRLRGQYATGIIDAEEFDRALRELVVEDNEGREWMVGANSGRWYYYDGANWVQGEPPEEAVETPATGYAVPPALADSPAIAYEVSPDWAEKPIPAEESKKRPVALGLAFAGMASILILGFILIFFASRNDLFASGGSVPTATPIVVVRNTAPTLAALALATATVALTRNAPIGTAAAGTPRPVTATPQGGFILAPTEPSTPAAIPTVTPLAPPNYAEIATAESSDASQVNNFPVGIEQAVYVTGLTVDPAQPKRKQPTTFTASFLNTTGGTAYYKWKITVFDPNKNGRNKDWGESPVAGLTVPPGTSTASITYTTVTNPGGCIPLQAVAGWKREDNARILFPSQTGNPVVLNFQVC